MNARANLNWISLYVLYKLEIVGSFKDSRLNECWVKIFKSLYNIHRRHRKLSLSSWFSLSFQRNRGPSFQAKRINNFLFDPKRTLDPKLFVFDRGAPSSFVCIEIDEKIDWTDYSDTLAPSKKRASLWRVLLHLCIYSGRYFPVRSDERNGRVAIRAGGVHATKEARTIIRTISWPLSRRSRVPLARSLVCIQRKGPYHSYKL